MTWPALIRLGTVGVLAVGALAVNAAEDLPIVDSATLGTRSDLPWSELVQIDDPFEGQFIGVFDRNFFFDRFLNTRVRIEVQSLWTPESVRVLLMTRDRDCSGRLNPDNTASNVTCSELFGSRTITALLIKVDEQVFQVPGQNNMFPVSDELAEALRTAPRENIRIRLVTENGAAVDSEIGEGTVAAWETLYTD
ncbi:MAG: hypothetical protein AAGG51_13090 [Cyanobacteria bacterium P01_G01_bin.54]